MSLGCGRVSAGQGDGSSSTADGDTSTAAGNTTDAASGGQFAGGGAGSELTGNAGGQFAQGGSSAAEPRDCGALIDDMEDGTGRICFGAGRVGVWYSFNDQSGVQWPAETPAGVPIETSLIPGGRGSSKRGIHTYGSGFKVWGFGSGVGIDLNFDGTTHGVYDATRYQGVHFWARSGNDSSGLRFRVGSASTTAIKYGGTCGSNLQSECLGPSGVMLQLEPEWREYSVQFGAVGVAGERDRLTNIQFMNTHDFDFWIDDISFVDGAPNCCSKLPACQDGAHFPDAAIRRVLTVDDATGVLGCDRVCDVTNVHSYDPAIQSLSGFECLGALEALQINGTQVTDPIPIARLASLKTVDLSANKIVHLGAPFQLPKLTTLNLWGNQIDDVTALAQLTALTQLSVNGNQVTDASPLTGLTQLTLLGLGVNRITAPLSAFSALTNLQYLDLDNNQITTLGSVSAMPSLVGLDLSANLLTDLSALGSLSAHTAVDVTGNPLDCSAQSSIIQALRVQGLTIKGCN